MPIDTSGFPFPKRQGPSREQREAEATKEAIAFRAEVWRRHGGRDRATGEPLSKTDPNPRYRGEVCHLKGRLVMPEWLTDPDHAILLSAENHWWSDGRGGYLLKMLDPKTGEPATDATKPIRFIRSTRSGQILWQRTTGIRA